MTRVSGVSDGGCLKKVLDNPPQHTFKNVNFDVSDAFQKSEMETLTCVCQIERWPRRSRGAGTWETVAIFTTVDTSAASSRPPTPPHLWCYPELVPSSGGVAQWQGIRALKGIRRLQPLLLTLSNSWLPRGKQPSSTRFCHKVPAQVSPKQGRVRTTEHRLCRGPVLPWF